jgi:hypothetical protein
MNVARGLGLATLLFASTALGQNNRLISVDDDQAPEEYVVEPGDTLWEICKEFFNDPWMWPTVWALNPHVTNPHWIYPGDILRLRVPPSVARGETLPTLTYVVGSQEASHVNLNTGFIAEKPIEEVGSLSRSPQARLNLGENDLAYLKMAELDKARPAQRFSVYRVLNDVIHPESGDSIGQKVQVLGVVQINEVGEHYARADIKSSFSEMRRGDLLMPEMPYNVRISPKQNLIDLKGQIVEEMGGRANMGQLHVVFIDRGTKDGVQVGNRLFVMRRFDGRLDLDSDEVDKLPDEQIGEVMVVDAKDRSATALVTRSAREIYRGDRLVMERHY